VVNGVLEIQGNVPLYLAFPPCVGLCGGMTDFPLQRQPKSLRDPNSRSTEGEAFS
jgi:hypothetical protein